MQLTVKERILLHLSEFRDFADALTLPPELTQGGIAQAVWIDVRHVVQYVRPLAEEGLVTERMAHIEGGRRRRKVYELTGTGRMKAYGLQKQVKAEPVRLRDAQGSRVAPLAEVLKEAGGNLALLEVLRQLDAAGEVDVRELQIPTGAAYLEVLSEAPDLDTFVGRERELALLTGEEGDEGGRLFVIRGVAGIGKSSLAAEACARLKGRRNLFWHRLRAWDTRDSILARLGAFLGSLGRPGLQAVLKRGDADRAPEVFREDLRGTQAFLVFDDAHEAAEEVEQFFRVLLEALVEARDARAAILTRTALSFYSRRHVVLQGVVQEVELSGLEADEVASYLAAFQMPEPSHEVAHQLHGHPLFLELLRAHNPFSGALVDVTRYLEEEVYAGLSERERGMMELASIYRVPVPREALFADPEWSLDDFLSLRDRALLRPVAEGRFEAHDTIREFFGDLLTPPQRELWSAFAVQQLRALASEATDAGEYAASSGYLSNALALSTAPEEQAELWEALGDVSQHLGDLLAVSRAYREAAALAVEGEGRARGHRKSALALIDWGDFKEAAEEVESGFEALGDASLVERGWLHLARCRIMVETSRREEAKQDAQAALSIFEEEDDLSGQANAHIELAYLAYYIGWWQEGEPTGQSHLETALELSKSLDDPDLAYRVHARLAELIAIETGDSGEVAQHLAAIEALPQAMENLVNRVDYLQFRGWFNLVYTADDESAIGVLTELVRLAEEVRNESALSQARYLLGSVAVSQENLEEARRLFEEAAEGWRNLGVFRLYGNTLFHAARCCLMQGDVEGFQKILEILEDPDMGKAGIIPGYRDLGRALGGLVRGDADASFEILDGLVEEVESWPASWGTKFELPRIHLIYGIGLRLAGREREAQERIHQAREMYRSAHMMGALAEAEVIENRLTEGLQSIAHTES